MFENWDGEIKTRPACTGDSFEVGTRHQFRRQAVPAMALPHHEQSLNRHQKYVGLSFLHCSLVLSIQCARSICHASLTGRQIQRRFRTHLPRYLKTNWNRLHLTKHFRKLQRRERHIVAVAGKGSYLLQRTSTRIYKYKFLIIHPENKCLTFLTNEKQVKSIRYRNNKIEKKKCWKLKLTYL